MSSYEVLAEGSKRLGDAAEMAREAHQVLVVWADHRDQPTLP